MKIGEIIIIIVQKTTSGIGCLGLVLIFCFILFAIPLYNKCNSDIGKASGLWIPNSEIKRIAKSNEEFNKSLTTITKTFDYSNQGLGKIDYSYQFKDGKSIVSERMTLWRYRDESLLRISPSSELRSDATYMGKGTYMSYNSRRVKIKEIDRPNMKIQDIDRMTQQQTPTYVIEQK